LAPAVIALHGGGGWYGRIRPGTDNIYDLSQPDAFVICPCDNILIKKTGGIGYQKTYWLGYWEGYDRFRLPSEQPVPDDGLVIDYTMRRIDWELGWLLDNESIDPKRVSLLGGSMGGRGANYQARVHPERYAAWLSLSPGLVPQHNDPLLGLAAQNVSTNLPGAPGVLDVMDLYTVLSGTKRDIPLGKIVIGRADQAFPANWRAEMIQAYEDVNDTGFGCHLYWDERAHVYTPDSHWANSSRLKAKALTWYHSDQSFPAFFNDDQDTGTPGRQPDMGNGDPSDGDVWGTWSGYYHWDPETVVDSPTQWEATVFLISSSSHANDVPSFASSKTDISIRRPQQFTPADGITVEWTLTRLSDSQVMQSGQETVTENGLVTIPNLTIYKDKCRLSVSILPNSYLSQNEKLDIPTKFAILQNYPNPFNPITSINFSLPKVKHVKLNVYDVNGRLLSSVIDDHFQAGTHMVQFDGSSLPSGMYIYKIEAGSYSESRKMLLIR
jgi:dienelactone hydrolase